jgi:hypothetical protein
MTVYDNVGAISAMIVATAQKLSKDRFNMLKYGGDYVQRASQYQTE